MFCERRTESARAAVAGRAPEQLLHRAKIETARKEGALHLRTGAASAGWGGAARAIVEGGTVATIVIVERLESFPLQIDSSQAENG